MLLRCLPIAALRTLGHTSQEWAAKTASPIDAPPHTPCRCSSMIEQLVYVPAHKCTQTVPAATNASRRQAALAPQSRLAPPATPPTRTLASPPLRLLCATVSPAACYANEGRRRLHSWYMWYALPGHAPQHGQGHETTATTRCFPPQSSDEWHADNRALSRTASIPCGAWPRWP